MRIHLLSLSVAILFAVAPGVALATCYHACSDINVSVGDYIVVRAGSETPCSWACSGDGFDHAIWIRDDCVNEETSEEPDGAFCADENIPDGVYYVDSIGSGCSGRPNGCIRICTCP
jgi:hypothetical protein